MAIFSRPFRIFLLVVGIPTLCLLALTMIPVTPETALFLSVRSPDRFTDMVSGSRLPGHPNGEFIIHGGNLYLKIQGTRSALVLVTIVSRYDWTLAKLKTFRAQHPELERYFPDSTKPNGGIAWIPNEVA